MSINIANVTLLLMGVSHLLEAVGRRQHPVRVYECAAAQMPVFFALLRQLHRHQPRPFTVGRFLPADDPLPEVVRVRRWFVIIVPVLSAMLQHGFGEEATWSGTHSYDAKQHAQQCYYS